VIVDDLGFAPLDDVGDTTCAGISSEAPSGPGAGQAATGAPPVLPPPPWEREVYTSEVPTA
jgi:hypothetical protein